MSSGTAARAWSNYLDAVPAAGWQPRVLAHLRTVSAVLASLPAEKSGYAYAPGKWTVNQLVGHVLVSQRVFVSRAVFVARGETQPLPGYDENAYAHGWPGAGVPLSLLAEAYAAEAASTASWIGLLGTEELEREGVANNLRIRPSWMFRALVGHESHHLDILRERYGLDIPA